MVGAHGPVGGDDVRASDRDRDEVAAELRIHCVEGRITVEELEERLECAMAARAVAELCDVVRDLPKIGKAARQAESPIRARVGPPGMLPFTHRVVVPAPREETRGLALDKIAPGLNANGYELISQSPNGLVFERCSRPGWAVAAAILLFPVGLLALGQRNTARIVISLEEHDPHRTNMAVHGTAPRPVRKAFAELSF